MLRRGHPPKVSREVTLLIKTLTFGGTFCNQYWFFIIIFGWFRFGWILVQATLCESFFKFINVKRIFRNYMVCHVFFFYWKYFRQYIMNRPAIIIKYRSTSPALGWKWIRIWSLCKQILKTVHQSYGIVQMRSGHSLPILHQKHQVSMQGRHNRSSDLDIFTNLSVKVSS